MFLTCILNHRASRWMAQNIQTGSFSDISVPKTFFDSPFTTL
jgi:hypothetical protein